MTNVVKYTDIASASQELKIEFTILKYHMFTVELKMNKSMQNEHNQLYALLIKQMKLKSNDVNQTAFKLFNKLANTT